MNFLLASIVSLPSEQCSPPSISPFPTFLLRNFLQHNIQNLRLRSCACSSSSFDSLTLNLRHRYKLSLERSRLHDSWHKVAFCSVATSHTPLHLHSPLNSQLITCSTLPSSNHNKSPSLSSLSSLSTLCRPSVLWLLMRHHTSN